jgi:two-component system response regulator MprA
MRILIVDDEPAMRAALRRALALEGFQVEEAADGEQALYRLFHGPEFDLVLLDVLMPAVDGVEVTREVRRRGMNVPILMVTARDGVTDRVQGLESGADDYLVKPFAYEELVARVRALLRRSAPATNELTFSDLTLNLATRQAERGGRRVDLTRTEFDLLELFLRNPNRVLPRDVIVARVWWDQYAAGSNSLNVYVGYLRRKTEVGGLPRLIHTVRDVGYVLREP